MKRLTTLWLVAIVSGYYSRDAAASDQRQAMQPRAGEIVCTITFDVQDEYVVFTPGSAELSAAESTCLVSWIERWDLRRQDGHYHGVSIVTRGEWVASDRVDLTLAKRRAAVVRDLLVEHGVPIDLIHMNALGPLLPYAASATEVASSRGNYAEIFVQ